MNVSTNSILTGIRSVARKFGVDIRRYGSDTSDIGRLSRMLSHHKIDLVFDVGANTGQFAGALRAAGYTKRMVSFEPLSSAHTLLLKASRNDALWEVSHRTAIGDHEGEIEMHIAGNSVSSSVLDMLERHSSAAPKSAYVGIERAPVSCLDTVACDYLKPDSVPFLKIDTQGYEDRVLGGAVQLLEKVKGLQLELSFVPLYDGQLLHDELVERLRAIGFAIWGVWPGFCDPNSGRMLQVDVAFFRD